MLVNLMNIGCQVQVNPDDLIPQLPRLSDLQPFPTTESLVCAMAWFMCALLELFLLM